MKQKKDSADSWTDEYGFTLSKEEMIEEIKLLRLVNRNLHDLLFKYKVPVQAIANIENQVKKQLNMVNKPQLVAEVAVQKETKKLAVKKLPKNVTKKKK